MAQSDLSLKFLVSGSFAGSLIGKAGSAVKELSEISECRVTVSGIADFYPGTSERVIVIAGGIENMKTVIELIWELILLQSKTSGKGRSSAVWTPKAFVDSLTSDDTHEVTGKITVPADAGGLLLGRGGANMRQMVEESGAKIQMTTKEEAIFTQERIVTINGTITQCRKASILILMKLSEEEDAAVYANRSTKYSPMTNGSGLLGRNPRGESSRNNPSSTSSGTRKSLVPIKTATSFPATTQITLTVAESLIGNIIGKQKSTLREMIALSGADIEVSPRGENPKGNDERVVTISGTPACAQTAHLFCLGKLQQGKTSPRKPRRRNLDSKSGESVDDEDSESAD